MTETNSNSQHLELQPYTGTRTARALNWAALTDEELKRAAARAASERDAESLWRLAEAYLTLRSGRTPSPYTLRNYEHGVRQLLEHWQGENLLRPSRHAADTYTLALREEGLAPGTIALRLAAARLLYKALRWAGATTAAPLTDVRAPHDPTPAEEKRAAYPLEHVNRMLEKADTQDRALILLGAHGGLRVSEMLALDWADVQPGSLTVRSGKGGKRRTIRLSAALEDALTAWRAESNGEGRVLPYRTPERARQRLERVCALAGVPYLGMHSLRHSCGTRLASITSDLRVTARHLGHASTNTSAIYAKMNAAAYSDAIGQL